MKYIKHIFACASLVVASSAFQPLMAQVKLSDSAYPVIVAPHNQSVSYRERTLCYDITANVDFNVTCQSDWISVVKKENGTVFLHVKENPSIFNRVGFVTFANEENGLTETLTIKQGGDASLEEIISSDTSAKIKSASANTQQSNNEISKSYDGKTSTLWHSQWTPSKFEVSEKNPAILTYNFSGEDHIDYISYTTRTSESNGNFGLIEIYAKCGSDSEYKLISSHDCGKSSGTHKIGLGTDGIDNVKSIQIKVLSGAGGYASCAEMAFMKYGESAANVYALFADKSLSSLKEGVTLEQIKGIENGVIRGLALGLYNKTYSKDYRVADYSAVLNNQVQADMWNVEGKYYDQRPGVTGINISKGRNYIAVSNLPEGQGLPLIVTAWFEGKYGENFDGGNPQNFQYMLYNGLNVIDYNFDYDGLAYVCYYANTNPELQPKVRVHFLYGQQNGYLDLSKTNEQMHELTANAKSMHMDVLGKKVHCVWEAKALHDYCKAVDGSIGYRQYINVMDSLVIWEHDLLGFKKYNLLPTNRTFAYVNYTYYMFQGGLGVSFVNSQQSRILNCKRLINNDNDLIWGLSHEWGHQHQLHPYFCWGGMTEVTNNMNSYYNIMKMGYHVSDKIDAWIPARRHFVQNNYNDITTNWNGEEGNRDSKLRSEAYKAQGQVTNPDMLALCKENSDSTIKSNNVKPLKSLSIYEVGVGEILCPFIMLYNYATTQLHIKDFGPDLYQSLRETDKLNGGSVIEKQDGDDKYELIASAQNGNKNGKYAVLKEKFPNSCWITKNYVTESSSRANNSIPFVLNFVRKTSRLTGYNLFPYFERWGFLRQVALRIGDYGNSFSILTADMYNEFKADMDQLVKDGVIKEMPASMNNEISNCKDLFNIPGSGFGTTPTFDN